MRSTKMALAVGIAWLGIVGLVVRAEVRRAVGREYVVPIEGYDPRDLLSGHYLLFRYAWPDVERDACEADGDDCCLCLAPGPGRAPIASATDCNEAPSCRDWVRAEDAFGAGRYFVPEGRGSELEAIVREGRGALRVRTGRDGRPTIVELLVDGRPWIQAVAPVE